MYCQSCGAENTEGARFCNMCGTSLAKAGEAGGLLTHPDMDAQMAEPTVPDSPPKVVVGGPRNEPGRTMVGGAGASGASQTGYNADLSGGASMMGVSLAGIGVKSSKKTWSMILLIALILLGAGALASWLAMGGSNVADGHAEPDDPFVIGSPLPGDGDVDSITGMAGVATSANGTGSDMRTASMGSGSTTSPSMSDSMATQTNRPVSMTTSMTTSTTSTSTMTTAMTTAMTPTMTATMTPSMTTTSEMSDPPTMTSTMTSTMSTSMGEIEVPEERDIEMELYSARVRFLIQRYYASRAQSCFDRATRNNPSVSGTVVISMTIGAEGNVSRTRVARNTTGNEPLGNCLSAQVSSWRLSAPPGGSLQMQIPFSR